LARTPQTDQAFLREVDEEVRRERMTKLARRYGVIVAAAVAALLIVFGGFLAWRYHRDSVAGDRGEQLTAAMSALTTGNAAKARTMLDPLAADGGKGYAPLAKILLADMAVRDGKTPDAARAFMAVAGDEAAPQPVRDLALVRGTALDFDTLAPAEVIRRMTPLVGAGRPWTGTAGELIALAQLRQGQGKAAAATLAGVAKDVTVPRTLRERAAQLAADLGTDVTVGDAQS
jgi:hypothetical protein